MVPKIPMDLCECASEECEHGVGACVNTIIWSDAPHGIGLTESVSKMSVDEGMELFHLSSSYNERGRSCRHLQDFLTMREGDLVCTCSQFLYAVFQRHR